MNAKKPRSLRQATDVYRRKCHVCDVPISQSAHSKDEVHDTGRLCHNCKKGHQVWKAIEFIRQTLEEME